MSLDLQPPKSDVDLRVAEVLPFLDTLDLASPEPFSLLGESRTAADLFRLFLFLFGRLLLCTTS